MRRGRLVVSIAVAALAAPAAAEAAFPSGAAVRAADEAAAERRGEAGLAVIDSNGRLRVAGSRRAFPAASLTKAMLLVAYLRRIGARPPSRGERALLGPMVAASSNRRATAIYRRVGDDGLRSVARRAGMRRFSVSSHWARAFVTAADMARFMRRAPRLVPRRSRGYAKRLLAATIRPHRWGVYGVAARAGWRTRFKGGWRRTGFGRLVHAAALFEQGRRRFSLALLTNGSPSYRYGIATVRLTVARLFASAAGGAHSRGAALQREAGTRAHRRAGLADVRRYAPRMRLDLRYATRRNITGRRLPGYCRPWALLLRPAAIDLARVDRRLKRRGLALKVLDAYRPARASRALVRWAERTGRGHLVGTYLARRSNHNRGRAVDVTLVRRRTGRSIPMGTGYDHLGSRAHTLNARGRVLRNRLTLLRAMRRHGFANYRREWWHFEHRVRGQRYLDLTLGCRG